MNFIHQQAPALPLTSLSLILPRTGVCLEPSHLRGVSRLMTRQLFLGAGGLDNREFNHRLERLGAAVGATLASDFFGLRLTTLTENLDAALELFMLAVTEPNFDPREFAQLRAELLSGWFADREEHKPLRAQEMYVRQLYADAPTGYLADGVAAGLSACRVEDVRAHYARLFGGADPILAVLSDLPEAEARARIAEKVEVPHHPNGAAYPWDGFAPPLPSGRRVTIIPERDTNTDELLVGMFSTRESDPDWHIHRLIAFIFGGDMNSRLFRAIRGERGYSYGASCWYESAQGRCPRDQLSAFSMYTFPSVEHTAAALPLLLELYEQLVADGVREEELALARQALINSHPFLRDSPEKQLAVRVGRALYGLEADDEDTNRAKLSAVTPADVLRVLRATHHPERLHVVALGDPARLEPLMAKVGGVEQVSVTPYPEPAAAQGAA